MILHDITTYHEKLIELGYITKLDSELIKKYCINVDMTRGGISDRRMKKISYHLVGLRKMYGLNKQFSECNFEDLKNLFFEMRHPSSKDSKKLKQNTINDYVSITKSFFRFLVNQAHSKILIGDIESIKPDGKDSHTKLQENIPDQPTIKKIIDYSITVRDKTIYNLTYEAGLRPSEVCNLRWNQINFQNNGKASLTVRGKTNKSRHVPLRSSVEYLKMHKNTYPLKPEGNNYVFLDKNQKKLEYAAFREQLIDVLKRAGITNNITPHCFRHARITHMINSGVSEYAIKMIMWGNLKTNELATYSHIANKDLDYAIDNLNNLKTSDNDHVNNHILDAKECSFCNHINPGNYKICANCNNPLEAYSTGHLEQFTKVIEDTSEFKLVKDIIQKIAASQANNLV
ncbi:tyrosine-type recombinase/integrase [Methanochimaera problematica]|nr:tyrosine-type recombinase/integrase [Methanoplanus sp. FWC-SCC4]